jgi:sirohydrochlorin cobaltochelatase
LRRCRAWVKETFVGENEFLDSAVILIGHGSTVNANSAAPVYQHAAELRKRKLFAEVREGFWKQEPSIQQALAATASERVFLVPLFISEGYFSEQVIPEALGFKRQADFSRVLGRGEQTLLYCKPVGTHASMVEVLLGRAREVVERFPFPRAAKPKESTLLIAGHGTEQHENSRSAIERQVELLRARELYAMVHGVFLEEQPRIEDCYKLAETRNVIVVPFFISDGMHTQEDIPILLGEPRRVVQQRLAANQPTWRNPTERNGKLVWYTGSVGSDVHVAEVILERVREAASWLPGSATAANG